MPGWKRSIEKVKKFAHLPNEAKSYVRRIADLTGPRLTMVSVGPARGQTLFL
jgi:adenylosuccinate synthase